MATRVERRLHPGEAVYLETIQAQLRVCDGRCYQLPRLPQQLYGRLREDGHQNGHQRRQAFQRRVSNP